MYNEKYSSSINISLLTSTEIDDNVEETLNYSVFLLSFSCNIFSRWIYLEPIFGIGTLKSEMAAFQRIDKDFRYIMREISNDLRILSVTKISNLSTIIESLENQLSKCQSTLTSFILVRHFFMIKILIFLLNFSIFIDKTEQFPAILFPR